MSQLPKSGRGALYIVWGNNSLDELRRSTESLRRIHPDLAIEIATVSDPGPGSYLCKSQMFGLSPFRETVFLDADTVVLDDLSFAFDKATRFGLACCIAPAVWAQRHEAIEGEVIEYNTGVLFFSEVARPVFDAWRRELSEDRPEAWAGDDQASFAIAVEQVGFNPFVLPPNWNFRPGGPGHRDIVGPIKIWHHYSAPPPLCLNATRAEARPSTPDWRTSTQYPKPRNCA